VVEAALVEVEMELGTHEPTAGAFAPAAGACRPLRLPHVAKPLLDEPDAGNLHVRVRGSPGRAISRGHPELGDRACRLGTRLFGCLLRR
jgi:hypothetical protein